MNPRIRKVRGRWHCGSLGVSYLDWCSGDSPEEAYSLWAFVRGRARRWVEGRYFV